MWWDGKTWRNASEVNSDSDDQLQKDVREILRSAMIGQYLGYNIDEYLELGDSSREAEYKPYKRVVLKRDGTITEEYDDDMVDQYDAVEKPAHYNQGGIEAIDYIRQQLGEEGFRAYCLGNVYKYLHRHNYKGKPQEDLSKALWYLNKAKETF